MEVNIQKNSNCHCGKEKYKNFDECIFHCYKDDEIWNSSKNLTSEDTKYFWIMIREQIRNELNDNECSLHDFRGYHFPSFEDYIIPARSKIGRYVDREVNFYTKQNNEEVARPIIRKKAKFDDATFYEEVNFYMCTFEDLVNFSGCLFKKDIIFKQTTFKSNVNFITAISCSSLKFISCGLLSTVMIHYAKYKSIEFHASRIKDLDIHNLNNYNTELLFSKLSFENDDKITISNLICASLKFNNVINNGAKIILNNIEAKKCFEASETFFDTTNFNAVYLTRAIIALHNTSFLNSKITSIYWGKISDKRFCKKAKKITSISKTATHYLDSLDKEQLSNLYQDKYINNVCQKDKKKEEYIDQEFSKYICEEIIDRQSIRSLKHTSDSQGDFILGNKFYALEMDCNEKEHDIPLYEKYIHRIHRLISNHTQNWLLAVIWFFAIGLFSSQAVPFLLLREHFKYEYIMMCIILFTILAPFFFKNGWILSGIVLIVGLFFFELQINNNLVYKIDLMIKFINPLYFGFIDEDMKNILKLIPLNFIYLTRIVEAFIVYQIIMSIRKNTRRI